MKKIAIYGAVGYGLYHVFIKGKQAYKAINNIKSRVIAARNLVPGINQFKLNIDVMLKNEGDEAINVNTNSIIKLKRVNLYSAAGTLIGYSTPGDVNINIPAKGQQVVKNIPTVINSAYVLEALEDINNVTNVTTKLDLEIAGKIITI